MSENENGRRRDGERHPEHEHTQSHAGNGTVNHGPDGQPGEPGTADLGTEALAPDELALRRLLHQAVEEIEPTDGTLEHLRRAVPARRARKRQALVGMAAAALFIGTAVPALIHVSNASGSNADPSIAGNSSQAQGGAGQGKNPDGGESTAGGGSGTSKGHDKKDPTGAPDKNKDASTGAATGGPDPSASAPPRPPVRGRSSVPPAPSASRTRPVRSTAPSASRTPPASAAPSAARVPSAPWPRARPTRPRSAW